MKYPLIHTACLLSLMFSSSASAVAIPNSGQDNRIEWNVEQTWPTAGKTLDMVHTLDGKFVYILNDQKMVQVYTDQGQLQGSIPVGEGVSAIDIAPRGETLYLIDNKNHTFSSIGVSFVVDVDISGAPFKGPANAPVTMVLFTDFQCPYCAKIEPLLAQVLAKNPQTVKLVFKNMPLQFHQWAMPSARAAFAARKQGKFWEFHDRLFAEKNLSKESIDKIAQDLKLDMPQFEKDMASPEVQASIDKDLRDAEKAGVTGTPTVFINGRIPKQRSLDGFQATINSELIKLGTTK